MAFLPQQLHGSQVSPIGRPETAQLLVHLLQKIATFSKLLMELKSRHPLTQKHLGDMHGFIRGLKDYTLSLRVEFAGLCLKDLA